MPEGIDARAALDQAAQNDLVQRKIQMDALRARLGDGRDEKAKLRESCEGFESIFLQKMWEQMRKNVSKEGYLHSKDEESYQSLFDVELCKKMASAGGIGLADMLYEQLSQKLDHAGRATTPTGYRAPVATPAAPTSTPATAQAGKAPVEKLTAENLYAEAGPEALAADAASEAPAAKAAPEPSSLLDAALSELRAAVESEDDKSTTERRETSAPGSPVQTAASAAQPFAASTQAASGAQSAIPPMQTAAFTTGAAVPPVQAGPQASAAGQTFVLTPPNPLQAGSGLFAAPGSRATAGTQAASDAIPPMMSALAAPAQAATLPGAGGASASQAAQAPVFTFAPQPVARTQQSVQSPSAGAGITISASPAAGAPVQAAPGETAANPAASATATAQAAAPQDGNKAVPSSRRSRRTDNPRSASWIGHGPVSAEPKPLPRSRRSDPDDASPTPKTEAALPAEGRVVGSFGWGNEPGGQRRWSNGLDIQTTPGAPVRAVMDGSVAFVGEQRGLGSVVVLEHPNGLRSYYSGVEASGLVQGQQVQRGSNFAKVSVQSGSDAGTANSALLHFEIKRGEMALNPENILGNISS